MPISTRMFITTASFRQVSRETLLLTRRRPAHEEAMEARPNRRAYGAMGPRLACQRDRRDIAQEPARGARQTRPTRTIARAFSRTTARAPLARNARFLDRGRKAEAKPFHESAMARQTHEGARALAADLRQYRDHNTQTMTDRIRYLRFLRHSELDDWLALGWLVVDTLPGPHYHWSVLAEWRCECRMPELRP